MHRHLQHMKVVRQCGNTWLKQELRQTTFLDDSIAGVFPQPREKRAVVQILCGLSMWVRISSVGLPLETDVRIGKIGPEEFDVHFRDDFKLTPSPRNQIFTSLT
jgi:hypothetical protein